MYLLLFFLSLLRFGAALILPKPSGPFQVALRVHAMTDHKRIDPYAPNHDQKRQVLASIFWPVESQFCSTESVPYMPPATAEAYGLAAGEIGLSNDTFKDLEMEVCHITASSACRNVRGRTTKFPVAIFSPGAGNSRLQYSAMAGSLASYGYVVVLLDHPYDASIVEFPNGTIITAADIPEEVEALQKATQVRAEDISFVVSQIRKPYFQRHVFKGLPGSVDTNKITALGHSMGGASAAAAMLLDPRIRSGANLDGRLFEPVLSQGLDRPFMQLGRLNHRSEDTTWVAFWEKLRGPKVELALAGTVHGSFTDFPLVISVLGLPDELLKKAAPLFGSVAGEELQMVISKSLSSFFAYTFGDAKRVFMDTIKEFQGLSVVSSNLPEQ